MQKEENVLTEKRIITKFRRITKLRRVRVLAERLNKKDVPSKLVTAQQKLSHSLTRISYIL